MNTNVLILTTIQGHTSIAQAIEEGLRAEKISVATVSRAYPASFLYRWMYRYASFLGKLPYLLTYSAVFRSVLHFLLFFREKKFISSQLQHYQPRCVISVSFGYNSTLQYFKKKNNFTFISVVTDPKGFFPICLSEYADTNTVFDKYQQDVCQKIIPSAPTQVFGWFVRKQFEEPYDQKGVRKRLQLDQKLPTLLLVTGSEGDVKIKKLLPYLLQSSRPVQVIIACGSNTELCKDIQNQVSNTSPGHPESIFLTLSFTDRLHEYMQAADLVVGKAGPNTLFEAVATLTPFFALSHITGQEDGNLELIRDHHLGYVEENISQAAQILKKVIDHPKELEQFTSSLSTMAEYNKKAKKHLAEYIQEKLKTV